MSSWAAEIRRQESKRRHAQREAVRQLKNYERLVKERARSFELEQASLEVEAYEDALDELVSVHKEQGTQINWVKYASALPPHEPIKAGRHDFSARLARCVDPVNNDQGSGIMAIEEACLLDERANRTEHDDYARKLVEWTRMSSLAKRVLAGQSQAYSEAIVEFAAFSEIAMLDPPIEVTVHGPKLIGCTLPVKGRKIVPLEVKSLTASGKLSTKAMPKGRSQEIYQSYVCGCVLRVAREVFGLLPVNEVLLTAVVNGTDDCTGNQSCQPVLSVAIDRAAIERLNFERLDAFGAMENFVHRGDAKMARRSGELAPIVPLVPADLTPGKPERMDLDRLLMNLRQIRAELGAKLHLVHPVANEDTPEEFGVA